MISIAASCEARRWSGKCDQGVVEFFKNKEGDVELMFEASKLGERLRGLTFDDVLLIPRYSEISSRRLPNLETSITRNYRIEIPVVASNMDTISEYKMVCAMAELGGMGILHRFMSPQEQISQVRKIQEHHRELEKKSGRDKIPVAASVGVKEEGMRRADALADVGVDILTVDIAHGDSVMMLETLEYIKKRHPHIDVIAGNFATPDAVERMVNSGADAVKVGIGPGSMCTTRIITGHGMPQLTSIALCASAAARLGVPLIADGGIRNSGDMVKALSAGASGAMLGSLLAGTLETPGEIKGGKKLYRGMASKSAQISWRGDFPKDMAAEGEAIMVPCKGSVVDVIGELTGGLRSGMSYLGVDSLSKMPEKALFMEVTPAGRDESHPHGLGRAPVS